MGDRAGEIQDELVLAVEAVVPAGDIFEFVRVQSCGLFRTSQANKQRLNFNPKSWIQWRIDC
jgi:hypothetical protein